MMHRLLIIFIIQISFSSLALALSQEELYIENRVKTYLGSYLEPTEYSVAISSLGVVNSIDSTKIPQSSLPGLPGLTLNDRTRKIEYRTYFDLDGTLHSKKNRSPIKIDVVIDTRVPRDKVNVLRRMIPIIAGVDRNFGDSFNLKQGRLFHKQPDPPSTIDSLLKYRDLFKQYLIGMTGILILLMFLHSLFSTVRERFSRPAPSAQDTLPQLSAAPGPLSAHEPDKDSSKEEDEDHSKEKETGYSKKQAVLDIIEELNKQAEEHPQRLARLLSQWIESGQVGTRKAAILLQNFKIETLEGVLALLLEADVNKLKKHFLVDFSPFSEDNTRVLMEARQDVMNLVASKKLRQGIKGLEFLTKLETPLLIEILKDESAQNMALLSTEIPAHRFAAVLKALDMEDKTSFLSELCALSKVSDEKIDQLRHRMQVKAEQLSSIFVTKDEKISYLISYAKNIESDEKKKSILKQIEQSSPEIYQIVRDQIFLFEDFLQLPEHSLRLVLTDENPILVARACKGITPKNSTRFRQSLNEMSREIFDYELSQTTQLNNNEILHSRKRLMDKLEQLIDAQVIQPYEMNRANMSSNDNYDNVIPLRASNG